MKRFLSLFLSLALLLSLCACNGKEETETEGLRLYGVTMQERGVSRMLS